MGTHSTRDQIISAADQLFYQQGFEHTSFADIAGCVGISRGNFYHHFKAKDEILDAVIAGRMEETGKMLDQWTTDGETPTERIGIFVHILIRNQSKIIQYGCPIGTLCTELAKLNHPSQPEAIKLFKLFRTWLGKQFTLLGRTTDADALAMHLLARSQGVATLATAFLDEEFVKNEVEQMCDWVHSCAMTQNPDLPVER